MIYLVDGKNRSGKDFWTTRQLYRIWKRTGIQIYTTQPLNFKKPFVNKWLVKKFYYPIGFTELEEIFHVTNCIIYFTEGQELFHSQNWDRLPERFRRKLNIHAHDRIDLWVTTPHAGMIDINYRRLIHKWYHAKRIFQIGKYRSYYGMFTVREKDDDYFYTSTDAMAIPDKPYPIFTLLRYIYSINYFSKKLYDTEQSFGFKNYKVICLSNQDKTQPNHFYIIPKSISLNQGKRLIYTLRSTLQQNK